MSSIVTGILSSTVGLLLNKVRDKTADKLKDGDTTDAKIRELIVRELNDVKAKINGLSRKDLLTSYNFLLEGVNLLEASLDKSEEKQKLVHSEAPGDGGETSAMPRDVASGIITETLALSQAMRKMNFIFDKEFESAKERFKDARKKATEAFCNEALNTKDTIFAAKLRIVCEWLECLESPETAIANCLPFLKTLHSLPTISKIFSVCINGGFRSVVSKSERVENVQSVMLINYVLFQLVSEFGSKYCSAINWPTIELGDRSFHPILSWNEVSTRTSWGEEFIQPPNELILGEEIDHSYSAVNSRGEIISRAFDGRNLNVTSRSGEVKMIELIYPGDGDFIERWIERHAVDSSNNIHVLMYLKTLTENRVLKSHVLYVFNETYSVKQNCTLHFLDKCFVSALIAVTKNSNIIISMYVDPHVYVCDNAGELKHKFKRETSTLRMLTTCDEEIMLVSDDYKAIHRYTEKGDLKSRIKVPDGHEVRSMAFHHAICKIMVLTFIEKSYSYFLCYSEKCELENLTLYCQGSKLEYPELRTLRSHPSGPAVVLWKKSITFI